MIVLDDKKMKKSVVQHFRDKYNIGLQRVSLPTLQAKNDANPIYLQIERDCYFRCMPHADLSSLQ